MMSDDDARGPVWGDGSDLWSPISDDIRVGDWLDFMYLDRHCHAMIRSISNEDVKVGMVSDDAGEFVLPLSHDWHRTGRWVSRSQRHGVAVPWHHEVRSWSVQDAAQRLHLE